MDYSIGSNLLAGRHHNGNPNIGLSKSLLEAEFINMIGDELVGVVEEADLDPDYADRTQLRTAIRRIAQNVAIASYPTVAAAKGPVGATLLMDEVDVIEVRGHSEEGTGSARYRRATIEPSHQGKFQDASNQWWKLIEFAPTPQMFGAKGDGVTDDSDALQAAIDFVTTASPRRALYLPAGIYIISRRVHETTNGGRLTIFGDGKDHSIIKAAPNLTNTTLVHLGNSNHHGAYQAQIFNLGFDGNDRADGNYGLVLHEGGVSHVSDVKVLNCAIGIFGPATTGTLIDGKCYIARCTHGIVLDRVGGPVPLNIFDTKTSQIKGSPTNISAVRNCWIAGCDRGVYISGGAPEVSNCTFQSCGLSGLKHILHVHDVGNLGSSSKFAGAKVWGNWFEGGHYKYAIYVENLRNSVVRENHIIGSPGGQSEIEGAILIDALDCTVAENSVYRFFEGPVSDGRVENAAVYFTARVEESYATRGNGLTRRQKGNQYYFEGKPNPTASRDESRQSFAYFTCADGLDPVLEYGRGVRHAKRLVNGCYVVTLDFNRDTMDTPVQITAHPADDNTPIVATCRNPSTQTIRVSFFDLTGTRLTPAAFSITAYGNDSTR